MFKKSRELQEAREAVAESTELVGEAIGVLQESHELHRDLVDQTERATDLAVDALAFARERAAYASGVIALAKAVHERAGVESATEVIGGAELQAFAEAFPQWSVRTGFSDGHALKTYSRTISADELPPERRRGGELEHETYKSLADYQSSDYGLAKIFDTFGFMGNYVNGRYYEISISSMEQGPITYGDFARVLDAESYLIAKGYVVPIEELSDEAHQLV